MMNSTTTSGGCIIQPNPDVTGTGIRASIYGLALAGPILSFLIRPFVPRSHYADFYLALQSALSLQGLSLLCTSIYQITHDQLTLFHAICVVHLLALLGVSIVARGRYQGLGPLRRAVSIVLGILAACAFVTFNAYVWATAPNFGSQPQCNAQTVYVVFGVSISAISAVFRWLIIATLSLIVGVYVLLMPCYGYLMYKTFPLVASSSEEEDKIRWGKEIVNLLSILAFDIYAIVSLEQTIARNAVSGDEKEWTFGQILATFMLLGVVTELLNVGLASLDRRSGFRGNDE